VWPKIFDGATAKDAAVQGVWAAGFAAGFLVIAGLVLSVGQPVWGSALPAGLYGLPPVVMLWAVLAVTIHHMSRFGAVAALVFSLLDLANRLIVATHHQGGRAISR